MTHALVAVLIAVLGTEIVPGALPPSQDADATVVDAILRLERQLEKAIASDNQTAIDQLVANDYVFVSLTGEVLNRRRAQAEKLARLLSVTATIKEVQVRTFGTSAVAVGLTREVTKGSAVPTIGQYRWSHVFVRRNDAWQVVSEQWTRVN